MRVWELVNSVERLPLDVSRGQPSGRGRQGLAALVGVLALSTGAVGTFLSANGAGSAALVVGGIALLLFALLGDRLELLKVGNFEFHLREAARELAQRAVDLEAHWRQRGRGGPAEGGSAPAPSGLARRTDVRRSTSQTNLGDKRIADLSEILHDAKEYSRANSPSAEAVRTMFSAGGDGERIYALALMREDPEAGNVDCILDAIRCSRSAFEQGQALRTAIGLVPRLDTTGRSKLSDVVQQQLGPEGRISRSTDRRRLAETLLEMLEK